MKFELLLDVCHSIEFSELFVYSSFLKLIVERVFFSNTFLTKSLLTFLLKSLFTPKRPLLSEIFNKKIFWKILFSLPLRLGNFLNLFSLLTFFF